MSTITLRLPESLHAQARVVPMRLSTLLLRLPSIALFTAIAGMNLPRAAAAQTTYPITIAAPTNGQLQVMWDRGRGYLQCGAGHPYTSICSGSAPAGAVLEVRALGDQGFGLDRFGGACAGAGNPCSVTITGAVTLSATFKVAPWYTIAITPPTHGEVALFESSGPPKICVANKPYTECAPSYVSGSQVRLSATPDSGGTFDGWTGACAAARGDCTITLDANKAVSASFTPVARYSVSVTAPTNGGILGGPQFGGAAIHCGTTVYVVAACSAVYAVGTAVTFTPTPIYGYKLDAFGGDCAGQSPTCTLTISKNSTVSATFSPIAVQHTVAVTPTTSGSVSVAYDRTGYANCRVSQPYVSTCTSSVLDGTKLTITARPENGFSFNGFTAGCSGMTNPCTLTLAGNVTITAAFKPAPWYTLTIGDPTGGTVTIWNALEAPGVCARMITTGAISGCTVSYPPGTSIQLEASAAIGKTFVGFSGACSGTGRCTLVMDGNKSVTPTFR